MSSYSPFLNLDEGANCLHQGVSEYISLACIHRVEQLDVLLRVPSYLLPDVLLVATKACLQDLLYVLGSSAYEKPTHDVS